MRFPICKPFFYRIFARGRCCHRPIYPTKLLPSRSAVPRDLYFVFLRPFTLCHYEWSASTFLSFQPHDEMGYVLTSRPEAFTMVVTRHSPDYRPLGKRATGELLHHIGTVAHNSGMDYVPLLWLLWCSSSG